MNLLVTEMSGHLGQAIIQTLIETNPFGRIVGIDHRAPTILGPAQFIAADEGKVDLGDLLVMNQVDVLLYLGLLTPGIRPRHAFHMANRMLEAANAAGIKRILIPIQDRFHRVDLGGPEDTGGESTDRSALAKRHGTIQLATAKSLAAVISHWQERAPQLQIVSIRLCTILDIALTTGLVGLLGHRYLYALRGANPEVHFIDLMDAAAHLVELAAAPEYKAVEMVAGDEPLALEAIAGILEKRLIQLPHWCVRPVINLLRRFRVLRFDFSDIVQLNLSTSMPGARLRQMDVRPQLSSRQALASWRAECLRRSDERTQ